MAVFKNGNEETQAIVMGAAVALCALLVGRVIPSDKEVGAFDDPQRDDNYRRWLIDEAFATSRRFWERAKQEIGA